MPTYEYECTVCGHRFETFQSFAEKPLSRCPVCKGKLRKVLFPAGVIFKGSGWYATDSRPTAEKTKYDGDGKTPGTIAAEPVKAKAEPAKTGSDA
ncbi:MAG: FmdB family transcriptional regulator [Actinobacteria bacterium]|nr:FmdB family transcriptional regulator [Actinomycetota bacterium]